MAWTGTLLPFYLYTLPLVSIILPLAPLLISKVAASQAIFHENPQHFCHFLAK
jgi:hypothetical protein